MGITDASGVQPIGQLIGRPCGVMPNKCCGEVLRDPCTLTLGDEPLASGVEDGAVQLRMEVAQVGIPLHHFIDSEMWEQPASLWQRSIQQLLKDTMKRHLPLCSLGLQQPHRIGPDADKPSQISLGCDVVRHEPTDLPRAHAREEPKEEGTVQHSVLSP